jgi:hypothetical protein
MRGLELNICNMKLYTAIEIDDLLRFIASEDRIPVDSKRGMSIIDEYLYPEGLVYKPMRLILPEHYRCEISQKGKDFLDAGGFVQIEKEEKEEDELKSRIENLTLENLRLQNSDLGYKEKIRHQESVIRLHKYIEAVSWIISIIIASIFIFYKY